MRDLMETSLRGARSRGDNSYSNKTIRDSKTSAIDKQYIPVPPVIHYFHASWRPHGGMRDFYTNRDFFTFPDTSFRKYTLCPHIPIREKV